MYTSHDNGGGLNLWSQGRYSAELCNKKVIEVIGFGLQF